MSLEAPSENNTEIITDIQKARQALASLWHKDVDPIEFQHRLSFQNQLHQEALISHGYEMTAYLHRMQEGKPKERRDVGHLRFISGNTTKHLALEDALKEDGVEVSDVATEGLDEEEKKSHELLHRLIEENEARMRGEDVNESLRIHTPDFYSIDVAEHKALAIADTYPRDAIFSSDVVVLHGKDILEKPKSIDEARSILTKISGQEIRISSGSVLIATTSFGRTIINRAGVVMRIMLQQYSPEDIEQYLQEHKDYQSVAGVIDYADPSAQRLIAKKSIQVEKLTLGDDRSSVKVVDIDPALLAQMRDYCIGMPQEMIQTVVHKFKKL